MVDASKLTEECFYIAPIGPAGSAIRQRSDLVLRHVVVPVARDLGLFAIRADQIAAPGQITLQVVEHVLGAAAAVADLTGANPNVYYELAIRHTADLPVVLIAEEGENLHFDIAQMRTIFFDHRNLDSVEQAKAELAAQLKASLEGNATSPISATVDLRHLRGGADVVERTLAELVTNFESLSRAVMRGAVPNEFRYDLKSFTAIGKRGTPDRSSQLSLRGYVEVSSRVEYADLLKDYMSDVTEGFRFDLIVDLTKAQFVDAGVLGVLVDSVKQARPRGTQMALAVTDEGISRILEITGLNRVFPLYRSVADAEAALDKARTEP